MQEDTFYAFHPKVINDTMQQAGLLTFLLFRTPSHSCITGIVASVEYVRENNPDDYRDTGFTATGIVTDFNRIPF